MTAAEAVEATGRDRADRQLQRQVGRPSQPGVVPGLDCGLPRRFDFRKSRPTLGGDEVTGPRVDQVAILVCFLVVDVPIEGGIAEEPEWYALPLESHTAGRLVVNARC